jgi:hypothetical protein
MRKPATKPRLFVVPNSGVQVPDSPELGLEPGSRRFVQVPFDFDSLPDVDGGDNTHCPDSNGRPSRSLQGSPTSRISLVGDSSFNLWMQSQKLR